MKARTLKDPPDRFVLAVGVLMIVATGGLAGCLDGGGGQDDADDPGSEAQDGGDQAVDGDVDGGSGASSGPADWPSHGFEAGNTAGYGSPGDGQGGVLWESTSTDTQSAPAIANGRVYVGEENGMSAWDLETGEQAWWFDDEPEPDEDGDPRFRELSTPVVVDGTVYVSSIFSSEPGPARVFALDADAGEEEWRVELDHALRSAPSIGDGLVYFGTERIQGSGNAGVYAVDAETGEEAWTFDVGDNPNLYGSPIVSNGSVFFGTTGGIAPTGTGDHVYKLDAETGEEAWSTEFPGTASSVAVADGTVYVTDTGEDELVALDAGSGEELWAFEAAATPPAIAGDTVHTAAIDDAGNVTVHALDAATGDQTWDANLGPADAVSPVAFAEGTLVVTQEAFPEAIIFALDA